MSLSQDGNAKLTDALVEGQDDDLHAWSITDRLVGFRDRLIKH